LQAVLAEIPKQLTGWMKSRGFLPRAPPAVRTVSSSAA
jgi:hypothetical protein